MDDTKKIKPYISYLNKQVEQLSGEIGKLTSKSLDEQLLLLQDEKKKLDLSNKYAYVLSSLCFSYMKVLNIKDLSPIMAELARCKSYMDKSKQLEAKKESEEKDGMEQEEQAKRVLQSALGGGKIEPAISKVNFQGKHTKFSTEASTTTTVKDELANRVVDRIKKQKSKQQKQSGKVSKK
ncbi:Lrp1 [Kluyveromyces lactis]|nr:Lrp1 [Kluyveromyces lactis]